MRHRWNSYVSIRSIEASTTYIKVSQNGNRCPIPSPSPLIRWKFSWRPVNHHTFSALASWGNWCSWEIATQPAHPAENPLQISYSYRWPLHRTHHGRHHSLHKWPGQVWRLRCRYDVQRVGARQGDMLQPRFQMPNGQAIRLHGDISASHIQIVSHHQPSPIKYGITVIFMALHSPGAVSRTPKIILLQVMHKVG